MAKLKTPLLSFEAHKSVGNAVTFQRRSRVDFARNKPTPTNPKSLAQMYQRWDYQDGISYWNTLSVATKAGWRTIGSRNHMPALAAFMQDYLTNLPDLIARYHMDRFTETAGHDSGRNALHATVIGVTPASGLIQDGLSFDGINDSLSIPDSSHLQALTELSLELFIKPEDIAGGVENIIYRGTAVTLFDFGIRLQDTGWLAFLVNLDGFNTGAQVIWNGIPYHVAGTWRASDGLMILYLNGVEIHRYDGDTSPTSSQACVTYLGRYHTAIEWYTGLQDHVSLYNRCLSSQDILRHSQRRWPL